MAEIYQLDTPTPSTGASVPLSLSLGGNGGGMFGGGQQTNLMDLLGFAIVASIFPNFFGGQGGQFAGRGGINSDVALQAIVAQGDASRTAIQTLATSVGQDFNIVNGQVMAIQNALNAIGASQGLSTLQVINAIQGGNSALASQFSKCCCDNQLAMCQQTGVINQGFAGVQQSIASKAQADQMALFQQTTALNETMNRNYSLLDNKIDALESARKDREIASLTAQVTKLESQQYSAALVQQAVAPVLGQLSAIQGEVEAIKRCQPQTVTLPNNQYTAVPTLLANAGADFIASYWANRLTQATAPATGTGATTPATAA